MPKLLVMATAVLMLGAIGAPRMERPAPAQKSIRVATMCMFEREETSGMNKICYYNCLGSDAAITISAVSLCPLTINR